MEDRENAIAGLQMAIELTAERGQKIASLRIEHARAILAMLKEQEETIKAQQFVLNKACEKLKEQKIAMKPKNIDKVGGNCPVCGLRMARSEKYCYQCGQEMDWE